MKLTLRQIGNSLGIIIPQATLRSWGVGVGDHLELTASGIHPRSALSQRPLDEIKRRLAAAVVSQYPAHHIRAHSLSNLYRWKQSDAWVSAYDEWQAIIEQASDGELFATLLGRDERCTRLRQSPPYVGLLPRDQVRRLNEEEAP
jgi:antitoxin component of MazEF toxin-antitoxin module